VASITKWAIRDERLGMLCGIVYDVRPQISRRPCPECGSNKDQQSTQSNDCSEKFPSIRRTWLDRGGKQMAQRRCETYPIKREQQKRDKINDANDQKPPFEFKPGRVHRYGVNNEWRTDLEAKLISSQAFPTGRTGMNIDPPAV